jgi:DNA-3-methyladenine glycosylase II
VKSLAEHFESGQLTTQLLVDGTDEEISKALIAVRGIGQVSTDTYGYNVY